MEELEVAVSRYDQAKELAAQAKELRDAAIVQAVGEGIRLVEIGRVAGMSHVSVIKIRTRAQEAREEANRRVQDDFAGYRPSSSDDFDLVQQTPEQVGKE